MLERRFAPLPDTSLLAVPPHVEAAALDDGAEVFCALVVETVQKYKFSVAAAEKDSAYEGQNGGSKTLFLYVFV